MNNEKVYIYSGEHKAYWRAGANGYTSETGEAGTWGRSEAERRIKGCGEEKMLALIPVATTTPCLCVQLTNDALKESHPGVKVLIDLISGRPVIATVRISGKGKTPNIFPTFCPFCGVKYED